MVEATKRDSTLPPATSSQSVFTAPTLSLPKGGGALRSIGEKFSTNPVNGTAGLSVPIATSPGRSGFGPQLALSYDSGTGNGPFGVGWSLSLPSITRRTDKGLPRYNDFDTSEWTDIFILSGAEDLVPVLRQDGAGEWLPEVQPDRDGYRVESFRPRTEGVFARIERWTCRATGAAHWRSISRDNTLTVYGLDEGSRVADPDNPLRVFSWLICRSYDDKGNAILYEYAAENATNVDLSLASERNRSRTANRYPKQIRYGNRKPLLLDPGCPGFRAPHQSEHALDAAQWMFSVVFDYDEGHYAQTPAAGDEHAFAHAAFEPRREWAVRADPFSSFRAAFEVRTYRLCRRTLMFHHFPEELGAPAVLVKSTAFSHREKPFGSFLERVVQSGYTRHPDGRYLVRTMPPLELAYIRSPLEEAGTNEFTPVDIDPESLENLPGGVDGTVYRWLDLDGEGIAGILASQGEAWMYKHNLGEGRFGATETVRTQPVLAGQGGRAQHLMDIAGDGNLDLVDLATEAAGFYGRTLDAGWAGFRAFLQCPVLDWSAPNLRFVDLTGDGIADILITEDDAFTWHPSLLEEGFGSGLRVKIPLTEEESGPRAVFSDPEQTIYLADMTGDGLNDIVRIRNHEVCYWANRGHGRFAAKVILDGAPWFDEPDQFDQRRVRLADTDGTGTTDILYLGRDGVSIYLNLSGNALSAARRVEGFPAIDALTAVNVADLLGRGTACLVWSSPLPREAGRQLRYIDLMCGRKPHLLERITNNMGAETRIEYASSTEFYLQDQLAGTPWVTRLPFPVHVVRRVEVHDEVSRNRIVTRYSYHHGFYDGLEREFRGFARVDQLDTEDFATFEARNPLPADNWATASNVPPVLTKTWFHTGVFLRGGRVSRHLAHEYFSPPGASKTAQLNDTILPCHLTPFEAREACRALKGSKLRQEVYALDGTPLERTPYTVMESNFTIAPLQPKQDNRYAVFFTHAREAITANFERHCTDPRIGHQLTLNVDDYGNVLRSVTIGYQRCHPEYDEQGVTLATLTENTFTNAVLDGDAYRLPLPAEARTFELTAPQLSGSEILRFESVAELCLRAYEIPYEAEAAPGVTQKRLIERARTLYRANDLEALLPFGALESLALPGESYKQALTPGLLEAFVTKASPAELISILANPEEGGYRGVDGGLPLWIPSGRVFYSADSTSPARRELHVALKNFFLPHCYRDQFGHNTIVAYDEPHLLAPVLTRDAAGNESHATLDYRVLQPHCLTDANGNRAQARFDALGMLAGTVLRGKVDGPVEGDSFDHFVTDLAPAEIRAYFSTDNPREKAMAHLGTATTRVIYDLHRIPTCSGTIARETHLSALEPGQQSRVQLQFAYSDGFSRIAQTKAQAEPGPLDPDDKNSPLAQPRWVGTGATIYNNKGKPVRQYEPFFSATPKFGIERWGVSNVLFYDPVERVIATLHPNHSFEKTVFDAWRQVSYDANDTVLSAPESDPDVGSSFRLLPNADYLPTWYQQRSSGALGPHEKQAAEKAARHADTPTTVHFDSLGRTFLSIANNGENSAGEPQLYATRTVLDIEGNQRAVIDACGRTVMRYEYDMLGARLRQQSMESGERWFLHDAAGKPLRAWNSRGYVLRMEYDELHRPSRSFVRGGRPESGEQYFAHECLFSRTIYGDSAQTELTEAQRRERNLRAKPYRHFDGAGTATTSLYDFKGNSLTSSRQFATEFRETPDWARYVELEFEIFSSETQYDALNRISTAGAPDGSVYRPTFNDSSLLQRVDVNIRGAQEQGRRIWSPFVRHINYDAKGQRAVIEYGNGAVTRYTHERTTFRLSRMRTERKRRPGSELAARILKHTDNVQDLHYTYDPVGNITRIEDSALQTVFHANHRVDPAAEYTYDPIYRLLAATGREHAAQSAFSFAPADGNYRDFPFVGAAQLHDPQALRSYTEHYEYDPVGNIRCLRHQTPVSNFERAYGYDSPSLLEPRLKNNRLSATAVQDGAVTLTERYRYDAHGNMTQMPHLPCMVWDFQDQMRRSSRQVVNCGTPEETCYVYDGAGQRARKITLHQDGRRKNERYYLGGFEIFRAHNTHGVEVQRETLHVVDSKQRIALLETRTIVDGKRLEFPESVQRYQLASHLGSASLELDGDGALLTYEEWSPYGNSTFQAGRCAEVSLKRYRYTGKERDEENGFTYHGARYYAPWLGRWTACDPTGLSDGPNVFRYCRCNPLMVTDSTGMAGDESDFSELNPTAAEVHKSGLAMGKKPSGTSLDALSAPQNRVENKVTDARAAANNGARRARTAANNDPTGAKAPQAGDEMAHMSAARHNRTSKIPDDIANHPDNISAMPAQGKNATVTNQDGTTRQTDFHAAQEGILDEIQARNQKGKVPGTPDSSAAAQTALEEAKIKSEQMTREHLNQVSASPPATPEKGPPVDPATGRVIPPVVNPGNVEEASKLMRVSQWAAENGSKALNAVGKGVIIVGALQEAEKTAQLERANNRGELNAFLMWGSTVVVGVGAGVVDDALVGMATVASGSPAPITEQYDGFAGPVQQASGQAIRGFLDWSAHNLW
jgi:RHS repeat-associated protein